MKERQTLYSGRFAEDTDSAVKRLNDSLAFDCRLWREDIEGSIAHVSMLGRCQIIPEEDAERIKETLEQLLRDLQSGNEALPDDAEDIHTAIELLLTERIGSVAGKLHTARSRNDQVATDT